MTTISFNDSWQFARDGSEDWISVTLPHDAMIHETRTAEAPAWAHGAYFPGGRYRYRRLLATTPEMAGREVSLRFEGIYRHSRVLIDGVDIGGALSGYREFAVRLDPHLVPGAVHEIEVTVDNSETPNARWYTGTGIYRSAWFEVRSPIHIAFDGVTFTTTETAEITRANVAVNIANNDGRAVTMTAALSLRGQVVVESLAETTGAGADLALEIADAELWSADTPVLYDLAVVVSEAGAVQDRRDVRVGLRTITIDAKRGIRVNGAPVLLRGANVHHDSGILGAATFADAERRRVSILKENGFNAIRSAHNPAARALIDACDELGMYVMDELFDGWYDHKNDHDDADLFETIWRDEAASLAAKDRNSASVVMYSIGNENGEALTPHGRRVARKIVEHVRHLDPTRPITIGVNMVAATFAGLAGSATREEDDTSPKAAPDMTSTALNVISNRFGTFMKVFPKLRAADRATAELFEDFDIAGYNYGTARYATDARLHPERVMVGTESMPGDIARNWDLVERIPPLIGDFMWAGWDYLGEAGGGSWAYGTRRAPYLKPYPQLTSGTGAVDITGEAGAPAFLAQAAWGKLDAPAITVRPLDVPAGPVAKTSWRSTDAVPIWSWGGREGQRVELEIYSADDTVEVRINGRSLGQRPAGPKHGYVARFRTRYEAGTVEAIGYRRQRVTGRSVLRSAGAVTLTVIAETSSIVADDQSLAFIRLALADDQGIVDANASDALTVRVEGPGVLAGLGSSASSTEESFTDAEHTTFRGRALAVVRSTGAPGRIRVTATSRTHGTATVEVEARASTRAVEQVHHGSDSAPNLTPGLTDGSVRPDKDQVTPR